MLKAYFQLNELKRNIDIGCAEDEHGVKQEVVISMQVSVDASIAFSGDTYEPPYDYCSMITAVDEVIASKPRFILIETLFFSIGRRILADPIIKDVELSVFKTTRYTGCRSLGMRATLTRPDIDRFASRYAN